MTSRTSTRIANRARALRRSMTEPEIMLWSRLKGRSSDKPIFRRQFAYGSMFDFYCPAARLAIEIAGSTHWDDEKQEKDAARDAWLRGRGIVVLRIGASEVYRDLSRVADGVILRAEELIRLSSPARGRGGPRAERSEERVVERESGHQNASAPSIPRR